MDERLTLGDLPAPAWSVELAIRLGEWDEAYKRQVAFRTEASELMDAGMNAEWSLGTISKAKLDYDRAVIHFAQAVEQAEAHDSVFHELTMRTALAEALSHVGRAKDAYPHLERCRQILASGEDWGGRVGLLELAEASVHAAEGRVDEATRHFEVAIELFERYELPWFEAETLHNWGDATGEVAKLEAAIEIYKRIGAPDFWAERVRADLRA